MGRCSEDKQLVMCALVLFLAMVKRAPEMMAQVNSEVMNAGGCGWQLPTATPPQSLSGPALEASPPVLGSQPNGSFRGAGLWKNRAPHPTRRLTRREARRRAAERAS